MTVAKVLTFVTSALGALGLIWYITEFKYPIKRIIPLAIIAFFICAGAAILATIYIHTKIIYYAAIGVITLSFLITAMFYASKDPWYKVIFEISTQTNAFVIVLYIANGFQSLSNGNEWANFVTRALAFIIIFLTYHFYLRRVYRGFVNSYHYISGWIILTVVSLAFTLLFLSLTYFPIVIEERVEKTMAHISMGFAITLYSLTYVGIIAVFHDFTAMENEREQAKNDKIKMDYWQTQINAQDEIIAHTRKLKHDLRHHDNLLIEYLKNKDYDKALNYLEKHGAVVDQMNLRKYCSNYTVNCLLSSYIKKAEASGIKVSCLANIPSELNIDDLELASLYANLIENAIEACDRIKEEREKYIKISTDYNAGQLKIQIINTCNDNIVFDGDYPVSQKENPSGLGTKSVAEVVRKYDGMVDFALLNNKTFRVRIMMVV
ncbi:MAG: GHKL domain-containing protein [Clostridia bacterium]|nr:GHKL domain-containing protein [Clostridia bacterium]